MTHNHSLGYVNTQCWGLNRGFRKERGLSGANFMVHIYQYVQTLVQRLGKHMSSRGGGGVNIVTQDMGLR